MLGSSHQVGATSSTPCTAPATARSPALSCSRWSAQRAPCSASRRSACTSPYVLISSRKAYTPDGRIWVPRRSRTKQTWPGYLDNSVAGGITAGDSPRASMVRECFEEAGLSRDQVEPYLKVRRAQPLTRCSKQATSPTSTRRRSAGGSPRCSTRTTWPCPRTQSNCAQRTVRPSRSSCSTCPPCCSACTKASSRQTAAWVGRTAR